MILRKPYAFFIKMFKPIHIGLAISIGYLIYISNKVLSFLSTSIYSDKNVVGQGIAKSLISYWLYIIPIVIIIFSLIILGIMINKKKPAILYFVSIFMFLIILIINFYTNNFLLTMENSIISVKTIKLIHDLMLINIIVESIIFTFFIIRGAGINLKKFNFDSEVTKLNISDKDKEEIELNLNFDLSGFKSKSKKKFRNLKYKYIENKFIINIVISVSILIVVIAILFIKSVLFKLNKEGDYIDGSNFSLSVNSTFTTNKDYYNNKITNNYVILLNINLKSNFSKVKLNRKDFKLKIGEAAFEPIKKYENSFSDIGVAYNESILTNKYNDYLFIYEIPTKYLNSNMYLSYTDSIKEIKVKLSPDNLNIENKVYNTKKINEWLDFKDTLGDLRFKITNYEINNNFVINYNYCIINNECIKSKEYLKPSMNQNFDKAILKLDIEFLNNSKLSISKFYDLFSKFGSIHYKINDKWEIQSDKYEEIISQRKTIKNTTYIGINSKILTASSIKLVFNIRGAKYEYLLK